MKTMLTRIIGCGLGILDSMRAGIMLKINNDTLSVYYR